MARIAASVFASLPSVFTRVSRVVSPTAWRFRSLARVVPARSRRVGIESSSTSASLANASHDTDESTSREAQRPRQGMMFLVSRAFGRSLSRARRRVGLEGAISRGFRRKGETSGHARGAESRAYKDYKECVRRETISRPTCSDEPSGGRRRTAPSTRRRRGASRRIRLGRNRRRDLRRVAGRSGG